MLKAAIVILNYNGRAHLQRFLPGVVSHAPENTRVIVADNASTDDSEQYVRENHPTVRWIGLDKNHGYAEGYNLALKEVEAEYFALLNSDVEVTPRWLDGLIDAMDRHPDVAACQPKILDLNRKDHFEYAGGAGGFIDKHGFLFCRGRVFDHCEKDEGQYDDPAEVFWASGACFVVRSSIFRELGGFDADYFAHMEEIDFCWRIKNRGGRIFCFPDSVVYHLGGGTLESASAFKTYLNFRNNLSVLLKNSPRENLFGRMFTRMCLDGGAAFHLMFSRGFAHFMAVVRAHFYFYVFLPDVVEQRRKERAAIASGAVEPNLTGLYRGSVVMDYFRKKKRRYTELDVHKFEIAGRTATTMPTEPVATKPEGTPGSPTED